MAVSGKSLSSLNDEIMKYSFSGEKNFKRIGNPEMIMQALLENYSDANILLLDGIRFDYPDWWFIIRKSGTEPLVRLVAEADNDFLLEEKMKELKSVIEGEKI